MEPKERLRKVRRVLAVQAAIDRLAAWRSGDLAHQDQRLRERQADLIRFLDAETALGDVFSASMLTRLQGLAESRAAVTVEKEACDATRRAERLRLRCVERIVDALDRETRRIDELRELERVVEASRQRARVRPGQG